MNDNIKSKAEKLEQILNELKAEYLATLPSKIALLEDLIHQSKWNLVTEELHKLKGTGKTYGLPEVSTLCEPLEIQSQIPLFQDQEYFLRAVFLLHKIREAHLNKS